MKKHLAMRYNVTIGILVWMVCSFFPGTGFAAKVSTTPDILGSTGKTKLESAYAKYFDDDQDGKGGALFHYMANGSAYIASDYDNDVGNGYRAVKSEGQSYGMMLTLQMNDEINFNVCGILHGSI